MSPELTAILSVVASSGFVGTLALLVRNVAGALKDRSEARLKEAEAKRISAQTQGTEAGTEDALVRALIKRVEASEARSAAIEGEREEMRRELDTMRVDMGAMRVEMYECERRSVALRAQIDQLEAAFSTVRPDRCVKCGGIVAAG